jgi:RNA polymerase sigma factor (sigma-70 family)
MSAFQGQYPRDLRKVIGHAKRLMKILSTIERGHTDAWFLGRAGELRGVVSLALADWRSGTRDTEAAGKAILSYVDALHRGASRKLRCGLALECCALDEVITAVALDEWVSTAGVDTPSAATLVTHGPTLPAGWVDSPEILARVREGQPLVEGHARAVARRAGTASATLDDLRAFGREGLLDAARAFDERHGVPFDRWASLRIRNAMIDGVRRWGPVPAGVRRRLRELETAPAPQSAPDRRSPVDAAKANGPAAPPRRALFHPLPATPIGLADESDGRGETPEDLLERAQVATLLRTIVAELPKQERALIEQSYFNGLTLEQAALSMGLSPSWADRAHARAIKTMERELHRRDRTAGQGGKPWSSKKS